MRFTKFAIALPACAAALALASCGEEPEAVAVAEGDCPPGIEVANGWMALPAVAGNPAAAYFDITNGSDSQITIRGVDVLGAESGVLHETTTWNLEEDMQEILQLGVAPGETARFEPGARHVMAMGMGEGTEPGGETEVTLTFVGGDKCSFPVTAYPAGEMPDDFEPTPTEEEAEDA
ncbi:copper chaperone PCu(A)C [Aurantiacibacter aquimixticola]|uniref:Copper chaperone PCu(A)C n=1 Tax=Aurantiacibacter aquimixticola TaxID=1958945 RepID=A0A419RRQ4_9SPHN|nr:copper chaperone PCu(A)C [Aurantiacibacter aquimixticola]RJY08483.1 copper chaperone PCu(A)C [Aurantiacibacter aquimixticola]